MPGEEGLPIVGNVFSGGGGLMSYVTLGIWVFVGLGVLGICGWTIYWLAYKRKNWNLDVEFKIPRSDRKLVTAEWGKGFYNSKRGVVFVKRKKKKAVAMKPFDITKYLQGERILTVVQITPELFIPVLPQSFLEMEDDKTGEEASLAQLKADFSDSKSWRYQFERASKDAYTIRSILRDYMPYIGLGIVIFMMWAGFAIIYTKVA